MTESLTYVSDDGHRKAATSTDNGTTTAAYGYDTAGRMVSRPDPSGVGTQSLSWDVLSNLTSAGGETYLYDGSGQRIARITDGAATVWVGPDELTDPDTDPGSSGDVTGLRFYAFGSSTVAVRRGSASGTPPVEVQFLVGDVQGSAQVAVDVALDSNGVVEDADASTTWSSSAYGPYGTTRDSDNLTITRGWLGQVEDTSTPDGGTGTGLTYLNARYYDPAIGRFLSPDPLMDPGDPRTLDPYRYADNNPIMYMDPSGLWPEWGVTWDLVAGGSMLAWDRGTTLVQYQAMAVWRRAQDPLQAVRDDAGLTTLAEQGQAWFQIIAADAELYNAGDYCGTHGECLVGGMNPTIADGPSAGESAALTIGHTVLIPESFARSELLIKHEFGHVHQYETFGAGLFGAIYLGEWKWRSSVLKQDDAYDRLWFERWADAYESPLVRPPASPYRGPVETSQKGASNGTSAKPSERSRAYVQDRVMV